MLFFSKIGLVTALGERILLVKILFIYVRIFKGYCPYETKLVNQSNSSNFDRNELKNRAKKKAKELDGCVCLFCGKELATYNIHGSKDDYLKECGNSYKQALLPIVSIKSLNYFRTINKKSGKTILQIALDPVVSYTNAKEQIWTRPLPFTKYVETRYDLHVHHR